MKNYLFVLFCFPLLAFAKNVDIPAPYVYVNDLPYDDHGWFEPTNAHYLRFFIEKTNASNIIEIGTWLGKSARFIAQNMPEDGKVFAVDTWEPEEAVYLTDPRLSYLYQLFLSNVKHANLCHKIVPVRMKSVEAAKALNIIAEVIYIDGNHETKHVIDDILAWYPHLSSNGIMCGDDWAAPPVREGVIKCAEILNKQVKEHDNFWWYE